MAITLDYWAKHLLHQHTRSCPSSLASRTIWSITDPMRLHWHMEHSQCIHTTELGSGGRHAIGCAWSPNRAFSKGRKRITVQVQREIRRHEGKKVEVLKAREKERGRKRQKLIADKEILRNRICFNGLRQSCDEVNNKLSELRSVSDKKQH